MTSLCFILKLNTVSALPTWLLYLSTLSSFSRSCSRSFVRCFLCVFRSGVTLAVHRALKNRNQFCLFLFFIFIFTFLFSFTSHIYCIYLICLFFLIVPIVVFIVFQTPRNYLPSLTTTTKTATQSFSRLESKWYLKWSNDRILGTYHVYLGCKCLLAVCTTVATTWHWEELKHYDVVSGFGRSSPVGGHPCRPPWL